MVLFGGILCAGVLGEDDEVMIVGYDLGAEIPGDEIVTDEYVATPWCYQTDALVRMR